MIRPILVAPHPILSKKASPVKAVDEEVRQLMQDMVDTMEADSNAAGLAAPQIGVSLQVVVINLPLKEGDTSCFLLKMANPEIIATFGDCVDFDEGCLSIPGIRVPVKRPYGVHIRYLDENNSPQELRTEGFFARCILHEVDHLNGVLAYDHLSPLKRNLTLRRFEKLKRREEVEVRV